MRKIGLLLLTLCYLPASWAVPEGPEYPSPEWVQREAANYAKVLEAPAEQVSNPEFLIRLQNQSRDNLLEFVDRAVNDPSWLTVASPLISGLVDGIMTPGDLLDELQTSIEAIQADPANALALTLNTPLTPLCTQWGLPCAGDPFRYPGSDSFYEEEGDVVPVVFYDQGCARISGRVWKPKTAESGAGLPTVIIENGSVQAPETLYWWAAQLLVRNGYAVMTFDPRGQGRSDMQTPEFGQGSNFNPSVFWYGLVDAIDFFRSIPAQPYPHNQSCAGTYATETTPFNPFHDVHDPQRLGLAGHSLGGRGVSVVQGLGGEGADPWPGLLDTDNPVDVIVAWDGLSDPQEGGAGGAEGNLPGLSDLTGPLTGGDDPAFVPRVPAMGHSSEYGLTPLPFTEAPDPEGHKAAYASWQAAGVPAFQLTIQGSSHYEWSLLPLFPATSWCPEIEDGHCQGGWGLPLAEHYTLAWFDRWLKKPGEPGYETADARLTADEQWADRLSFYFRSARDFDSRNGQSLQCEDIRGAVLDGTPCTAAGSTTGGSSATSSGGSSGGSGGGCALVGEPAGRDPVLALLVLLALIGILRHRVGTVFNKGN